MRRAALFFVSTLGLLLISVFLLLKPLASAKPEEAGFQLPAGVTAKEVIGSVPNPLGSPNAPYTRVEFGDYECAPCAQQHLPLKRFLEENKTQLRLIFRNYPLLDIHPFSYDAALLAEASGDQGKFWEMHDFLYEKAAGLKTKQLIAYAAQVGLERNRLKRSLSSAAKRVQEDLKTAQRLQLPGTPTLLLCAPDGQVKPVTLQTLPQSLH